MEKDGELLKVTGRKRPSVRMEKRLRDSETRVLLYLMYV